MRLNASVWLLFLLLAACGPAAVKEAATAVPGPSPPPAATPLEEAAVFYETMTLNDGTAVRYALVLPPGFTSRNF
ncbi:MAG: hypothetical protein ACE5E7_06045 [Anaerolineae bacterium]